MAEKSKIEWTEATWNPITGCSVVSPGCTNCYAMRLAGTRLRHHPSRAGLTRMTKAGPVWTGEVRLNEQWLDQPLHWKRPRKIFVCAHGDLFHPSVRDEWIDRVFAVMALCPQHTFQVLTKRTERLRDYIEADRRDELNSFAGTLMHWDDMPTASWPLTNVWLGTSVEREDYKSRINALRITPADCRFLSLEPLIGPLGALDLDGIHWVIVGGESGPGARPMDPDWAREIRDQCRAAGVPFFMKQMARRAAIPDDLLIREWPNARSAMAWAQSL